MAAPSAAALASAALILLHSGPPSAPSLVASGAPDSATAARRIVRHFPPVEVRAPLGDLRSSQTVHAASAAQLRALPIDDLADMLALQPGVVAQAEELHVRGGRAGETTVALDGLPLVEPLKQHALDVPLLALGGASLVSGAPEAQYDAGLAGLLDLRTRDPGARPEGEWRWQSDGRTQTHYDHASARVSGPLRVAGLGALVAGDATLDDTSLPALRSEGRHDVAGMSFGWRAENRLLGLVKLAPVEQPQRFTVELLANRLVHQPYDPAWSLDGWTLLPADPKGSPVFSPVYVPGAVRYRAADHLAITDERDLAGRVSLASLRPSRRDRLSLGWLRVRSVTSVGGGPLTPEMIGTPLYGGPYAPDDFHVLWGDYSLYSQSRADAWTLSASEERDTRGGGTLKAGAGLTYDDVFLREVEWLPQGWAAGGIKPVQPLDTSRTFRAFAPGGFAYVQDRWLSGGMILNMGLRLEWWTPGPQAGGQTLPGSAAGVWSVSPRLGIAYPIGVRDAFSMSYVRIDQPPPRDDLYDPRQQITNRQPLGNPALVPAKVISYEASLKHIFGPELALQTSVFYRDVYGEPGARDFTVPGGPTDMRYTNDDEGHAGGFEVGLVLDGGEHRQLSFNYTWMEAWGNESRSEGDPYGPLRGAGPGPITDTPLWWDVHHTFQLAGSWPLGAVGSLSWSTLLQSPLPWTPKPLNDVVTDLSQVDSRRLDWTENTRLRAECRVPRARALTLGLEVQNLFDTRGAVLATVNGYPNAVINTLYDDYGAYRTETGLGGGAYWSTDASTGVGHWVPVHDPRLDNPPRTIRASIGARW